MGLICLDLDDTLIAGALVEVETSTGTKLQRRQHELYIEAGALLPNRYNVLKRAAEHGDSFAIVTNQAGVAWGYHTQAEVYRRIGHTLERLCFFWGRPFSVHVAFMHPRATVTGFKGDDGRKPAPTMLNEAMLVHGIDPTGLSVNPGPVVMVGDRDEDREAAEAAGIDFTHAEDFFSA